MTELPVSILKITCWSSLTYAYKQWAKLAKVSRFNMPNSDRDGNPTNQINRKYVFQSIKSSKFHKVDPHLYISKYQKSFSMVV